MDLHTILVPLDFSPESDAALDYATTLARESGALLVLLHVVEMIVPLDMGGGYIPFAAPDQEPVLAQLHAIVPKDQNVAHRHRLAYGAPAENILEVAEDENADLIVMGTHGRGGLARLALGSVAEHVMRKASCPVLTVKYPRLAAAGIKGSES